MSNPVPRVIDLSHHNSVPESFAEARKAGIVGVIHKLTEGAGYVDDKVQARHYLAKQSTMLWGVYHFLRPGDMTQQAEFFVQTAIGLDVMDNNTVLVADHEDAGVPGQDLKKFLDIVENMTNRSPVVYSGHVLKDQLKGQGYKPKRRLWLCHYTTGTPTLPEGVDKYWMWQYTDKGTIPGVDPPTDLNDIGDADLVEFMEGWSGYHGHIPEPEPPVDEIPRLTISSNVPVRIHLGPNITIV